MGILAKIGGWVADNIPIITKVAKKAADVVHKATSVVEALFEGRNILDEENERQKPFEQKRKPYERPNVMNESNSSESSRLDDLNKSIDENKKKISTVEETNELEHRRIQLQIDIMELVVSSTTFERFTNNINLHAANLQLHLQAIQNTAGLLDSVNRQRVAIKALMKTVNHIINVVGVNDKVDKIDGIDIDIRQGSISIHKSYETFENTRTLLLNEIESFSSVIEDQLGRVENVRDAAKGVPNSSKKVSEWLNNSVEPTLLEAKKIANELKGELLVVSSLENNLRRELNNIKQDGL